MDSRVLFLVCFAVFSQALSAAVDNTAANPEAAPANEELLANSEYRDEQAQVVNIAQEGAEESGPSNYRPVRSPYYGGGYYGGYPSYGYNRGYYGGYPSYGYGGGYYRSYGHGYGGYPGYYGGYGHRHYYY